MASFARTTAVVLVAYAMVACFPASAHAQRFVDGQISVGAVAVLDGHIPGHLLAGWYADAMKSVLPGTAIVGEVTGVRGTESSVGREQWIAFLGGIRQRFVQRRAANVFAQFLVGYARYSQRFSESRVSGFPAVAFQPGIGVDLPFNQRWAIRFRTDGRLALGTDAEGARSGWIIAAGVERYWGTR